MIENAETGLVRRSLRDPSKAYLDRTDVKSLLIKIRENHEDTVILKLKDHMMSDVNSVVLDEIISALYTNKVCQALYFQNLSKAMNDEQLESLVGLLKKKKIWCMNLGENYNVSIGGWITFCNLLPQTLVTHLYISEHVISSDLKNKIRTNIRENRKKHDKHCSLSNIHVIEKCTNMWWNPINSIRHQYAADIAREEKEREEREREEKRIQREREEARENLIRLKAKSKAGRFRRPLNVEALTPAHAEYWAEGVGEGGNKPWKFACVCGERCSSYENFRYHPVGRMFECSACSIWSHVLCVLGNISEDDIEELTEVLCSGCRGKFRRKKLIDLNNAGIVLGVNGLPVFQLQRKNKFESVDIVMTEEDSILNSEIPFGRNVLENSSSNSLLADDEDKFEVGTGIQDVKGCFLPDSKSLLFAIGDVDGAFHCAISSFDRDDNEINQYCNEKKRKIGDLTDLKVKTTNESAVEVVEETKIVQERRIEIEVEVDKKEIEVDVITNIIPVPLNSCLAKPGCNVRGQQIGDESVHACSISAPSECQTKMLTGVSSSSTCIRHSNTEERIDVHEIYDTICGMNLSWDNPHHSNSLEYRDDLQRQSYAHQRLSFKSGEHGHHQKLLSTLDDGLDDSDHSTKDDLNTVNNDSNYVIENKNNINIINYDNDKTSSSSIRSTHNFDRGIHQEENKNLINIYSNTNTDGNTDSCTNTDGNTDSCTNTDGNTDSCSNSDGNTDSCSNNDGNTDSSSNNDGNADSCSNSDGNTDSCTNTDGNTDSCSNTDGNTDGNTDSCSNTDDELVLPQTFYKHSESRSYIRITSPSTSTTTVEMKISVSF